MNKLIQELQRLYFLADQRWRSAPPDGGEGMLTPELVARSLAGDATLALDLVGPDGRVRAMVVGFRAADWEAAATLHRDLQAELELPAPAVSVSAKAGYQLWLSLADPIPAAEAGSFLAALRQRYLADLPAAGLALAPAAGAGQVDLLPALDAATGKWSAFIDPSMGAMFADDPGLDLAPTMDRQADMLAGLASIKAADFRRALAILEAPADAPGDGASPAPEAARARGGLNVGSDYRDPKAFLLAVMNDASASADQRIAAATALLPYFHANGSD